MTAKTTAVAVKDSGAVSALMTGATGASFDSRDIILPSLTLRQNSYKKDTMKKFKPGDIISRPGDKLLAHEGEPVLFVPVHIEKMFRIGVISGNNEVRTVGYEAYRDGLLWEYEEGGQRMRRDQCFVAHILLRSDLDNQADMLKRLAAGDMVDPDDFVLPTRVVFTRASLTAGKVLNTHFEMSKALNNQSPAFITYQLRSVEFKNNKGNWYGYEVAKAEKDKKYTPKELVGSADFWVKMLATSKFKAVEVEDEETSTPPVVDMDEANAEF